MFYLYSSAIKILFQTYAKTICSVFSLFSIDAKYMSTLREGYAYHMFSLFLGYLNSKQTLFKSYLINCSLFHFPM